MIKIIKRMAPLSSLNLILIHKEATKISRYLCQPRLSKKFSKTNITNLKEYKPFL